MIQLHPLSAPFAGQAHYCAIAVRAPHALATAQCFCHSPGSSFLSAATLCIMLHFLMRQVTFFSCEILLRTLVWAFCCSAPREEEQSRKRPRAVGNGLSVPGVQLCMTGKVGLGKDVMKDTFHIYTKLISTCPSHTSFQLRLKTILFY